jgi:hypothetical protein
MVELQCTDYHTFNEILFGIKMTQDDLVIPTPSFLVEDRKSAIFWNEIQ